MDHAILEAITDLRAADPQQKYTFTIDVAYWLSPYKDYLSEISYSVSAVATGENYSEHRSANLREAVQRVIQRFTKPNTDKAAAIRQQIAALEAQAQALETEGK